MCDKNILNCKRCGSPNLFQTGVETFHRKEDADVGLHITVLGGRGVQCGGLSNEENGEYTVDDNLKGNPSGRRDGTLLHFNCENCCEPSTLSMEQHKGQTYWEWVL